MKRLSKIARSASPTSATQLRRQAYGVDGVRDFLRDVLAIANAAVEGPRYIFVGVDIDEHGQKRFHDIDEQDFSGKPSYQSLANEYIEPAVRIRFRPVSVDGKRIGVFEIGDCQDRPYMMRMDYSETLRRGDAYARTRDKAVKLGRRQLQELFEKKFRDAVSAVDIELGFPGEIIHKDLAIETHDLARLPSAIASSKLEQLINIQNSARNTGSTTVMARLTHARLFGADDPYVDRSPQQLMQDMQQIRDKHRDHDEQFLYESHADSLQLVVYNQGDDPIVDASLTLVLPNHNEFYVAAQLPRKLVRDSFVDRTPEEIAAYPSVSLADDRVQITCKIGDIPAGEPVEAFGIPVRICAGKSLRGRRFGVRFSLHGQNLRSPAQGTLRLLFTP